MIKMLKFVKILMCPVRCCVHCVVMSWRHLQSECTGAAQCANENFVTSQTGRDVRLNTYNHLASRLGMCEHLHPLPITSLCCAPLTLFSDIQWSTYTEGIYRFLFVFRQHEKFQGYLSSNVKNLSLYMLLKFVFQTLSSLCSYLQFRTESYSCCFCYK